jgi:hypothetical protein
MSGSLLTGPPREADEGGKKEGWGGFYKHVSSIDNPGRSRGLLLLRNSSVVSPPLTGGDKGEGEEFQDPLTPALSREGRGKFGKSPLPRRGEGVSSIDNPVPTRGQGLLMNSVNSQRGKSPSFPLYKRGKI